MAADPFKGIQDRYETLIQRIIENLDKLFRDLKKDKEEHKRLRDTAVHRFHTEKKEYIASRRAEMKRKAAEGSYTVSDTQLRQIDALQRELDQLLLKEMGIGRREAIAIQNDPARIDKEIRLVRGIIQYIKDKAGSKGKRRDLTREDAKAIYNKLKDVYYSVLTRKEEADLTATHFEPLKRQIEEKARKIINLINTIIEGIPGGRPSVGPSGGPSGALPSGGPSGFLGPGKKPLALPAGYTPEQIEKGKNYVLRILNDELGYFLRLYTIAKELDNYAKSGRNERILHKIQGRLQNFKTWEKREQRKSRVAKLENATDILLSSNIFDDYTRTKIRSLVYSMNIFEGNLLVQTVEGLEPKIKNKHATEVNWDEVKKITAKLVQDLQALTTLDEEVKKLVSPKKRK